MHKVSIGEVVLTADIWDLIELIPPRVSDGNRLAVILAFFGFHSLLAGVADKVLHVFVLHGIQDVPEVGAVRKTAVGCRIGHVSHEVFV